MNQTIVGHTKAVLGIALSLLLPGCFHPEPIRPGQFQRGYVLLLPGVECTTQSMEGIYCGLRDGGVQSAIDLDIWGYRPFGTFRNLPAYELNRQRANRIAQKLAACAREHPNSPITIVGFSGGGAMALFAAEALPDGCTIDRIILLGAAISPGYDPRPALAKCRRGMINFYSEKDWFMAGWATETFGTMDRVKSHTAGRRGFCSPSGESLAMPGLTQTAWHPDWQRLGHRGGHSGWLARNWAREILAPSLLDQSPAPYTRPAEPEPPAREPFTGTPGG